MVKIDKLRLWRVAYIFIASSQPLAQKLLEKFYNTNADKRAANWSKKRKEDEQGNKIGERQLNEWLSLIDWKSREVIIAFDAVCVKCVVIIESVMKQNVQK